MNKKNHFLRNFLVFIFDFLLFFSVSIPWFVFSRNQEIDETKETADYIVSLYQEKENLTFSDIYGSLLHCSNIRISVYDKTKDNFLLFDSHQEAYIKDTSIDRKELNPIFLKDPYLGNSCTMYQDINQSYLVKVSKRVSGSYSISKLFLIYGPLGCLIWSILICVFLSYNNKRTLRPLKLQISKLQDLTSIHRTMDYEDDLNYLTMVLRDSRHKLRKELEVNRISDQKMNFILDSFSEGLIVIDSSYKVVLINKKALQIFSYQKEDIQDRHLENLNAPHELEVNFSMVIHTNTSLSFVEKINSRVYQCDINPIDYSWTRGITNEKNGASLVLIDITDDYNSGSMKKEFFANASHELKSPLTSILGYLQLIESHAIQGEENVDRAISKCVFESKRMNKIISDMLTLSSLESQNLKSIEEIQVANATDNILSSLEPQIREKKISVIKDYCSFNIKMNLEDFDKLVRNLLDNAIKYNKQEGSLYVIVKDRKITIRDTGIGISLENQSRVFERFFRVDKARSKKSGDTGLGLAIVKHICNYYDLHISLESSLGVGSEFTVSFPIDKDFSS